MVRDRFPTLLGELKDIEIVAQTKETEETIQAIQELAPDVVVLDIRMPGGGGIRVLEQIKEIKRRPTIIVLTNYPYSQYRQRCMEEGADYFLDKSVEFETVIDILAELERQETFACEGQIEVPGERSPCFAHREKAV